MYCFEVAQVVIININTYTKIKPCVSAINDLGALPEFDEVGLVLLVARRYKSVDLAGVTCELNVNSA